MRRPFTLASSFFALALPLALAAGCGGSSATAGTADPTDDTAGALEAEAKLPNDLTAAQAKLVLKLIDDRCGDTWCEGDNNFGFRTMKCQFGAASCTMTYQIFTPEYAGHPKATYWRSCKTTGITSFASMVDTAANGYQSLNWDFYLKLDTCITAAESKLP